jgi:hypothetical protein
VTRRGLMPTGTKPWNCTTPACITIVQACHPIAPVLCPKCAFWRGMTVDDLLVPDWDLDANVYVVDPVTEDLDEQQLRVRLFNHDDLLVRRLRCLGIWPIFHTITVGRERPPANCAISLV